MRLPPIIRYLPARLAPLTNPLIWMPLCALGLTGVFIWEYRNHPEWLQWSGPDYQASNDIGLTAEEEGELAELDNLSVLLNETQSASPATSQSPPSPESLEQAVNPEANRDNEASSTSDLLADYFEQYGLNRGLENTQTTPSTLAANAQLNTVQNSALFSSTGLNPGTDSLIGTFQGVGIAPMPFTESPLAAALRQRATANLDSPQPSSNIRGREITQTTPESINQEGLESSLSSGNPAIPGQEELSRGRLPGVAGLSFIRTTPTMSPPPGTTGYTPPASLGLSTFERSFNPANVPPSASPAITPSFELRQPQRAENVLPDADAYQIPTQSTVSSPSEVRTTPNSNVRTNSWDAFWGGY